MVVGLAAHQAVGGGDYPCAARRPAAPRRCPGIACRAIVPVPAAHDVVAIAQRRHIAVADLVVGLAAHQAVGGGNYSGAARRPAAPGHRPGLNHRAVGPVPADHHVVAVAQRHHERVADLVACLAADQTVGDGDYSSAARRPAAPRRRPGIACRAIVPVRAAHHVVAVAQRRHTAVADLIAGLAAHQAVGGRDYPGAACCPAAPRRRPGLDRRAVSPGWAADHVVAIAQRRHTAVADLVAGLAAHQAVGDRDDARDPRCSVSPCHRTNVRRRAVVPVGAAHHIVAVAQRRDAVAANVVIDRAASELADERAGRAVVEVHGSRVGDGPGRIVIRVDDDNVAVGQHDDLLAERAAARRADKVGLHSGQGQQRGRRCDEAGCHDDEQSSKHTKLDTLHGLTSFC